MAQGAWALLLSHCHCWPYCSIAIGIAIFMDDICNVHLGLAVRWGRGQAQGPPGAGPVPDPTWAGPGSDPSRFGPDPDASGLSAARRMAGHGRTVVVDVRVSGPKVGKGPQDQGGPGAGTRARTRAKNFCTARDQSLRAGDQGRAFLAT